MSNIIQTLWIGKSLSIVENLCLNSFVKNGHEVHLYTYEKDISIPQGVRKRNANEILPQAEIFTYSNGPGKGSFSGFSNFFRYKLLNLKGGWWVDTDVIALKPFEFDEDFVFASEKLRGETKKTHISSCVIKANKSSKIFEEAFQICNQKNKSEISWGETGPRLVHELVIKHGMQKHVKESKCFNPVDYFQFNQILNKEDKEINLSSSVAVHLWNEMWRRNNINKNDSFPRESLFEKLKLKYL